MGLDHHHVERDQHHSQKSKETWEWIKALGVAVVIAVMIRVFLFAPIVVDGESMVHTLEHREKLIVNKMIYNVSEPSRGEIIVFHATESKDWIKRVIGEPGDIVQVRNGTLLVNEEEMEEPYIDTSVVTNDFYYEVPEDHLFVMGDNRMRSRDSRHIGPISTDSVVGRAEFVYWPFLDVRLIR